MKSFWAEKWVHSACDENENEQKIFFPRLLLGRGHATKKKKTKTEKNEPNESEKKFTAKLWATAESLWSGLILQLHAMNESEQNKKNVKIK